MRNIELLAKYCEVLQESLGKHRVVSFHSGLERVSNPLVWQAWVSVDDERVFVNETYIPAFPDLTHEQLEDKTVGELLAAVFCYGVMRSARELESFKAWK